MMAAAAGTYAARTCGNGSAKSRAPSSTATRPRGGRARPIYRSRCLTTIDTYAGGAETMGKKPPTFPSRPICPGIEHREAAFRGSPDNSSSYGRMEGSRGIIVREEEQIVPLIERPWRRLVAEGREHTRILPSSFFFFFTFERERSAKFVFEYKASDVGTAAHNDSKAPRLPCVVLGRRLITAALCRNTRENKRYRCTINSFPPTFTSYFGPLFSFGVSIPFILHF